MSLKNEVDQLNMIMTVEAIIRLDFLNEELTLIKGQPNNPDQRRALYNLRLEIARLEYMQDMLRRDETNPNFGVPL